MENSSNSRGILIAVEGIDGAGKTTQVRKLQELLSSVGESVIASKEPTDGQWGTKLRESAKLGRLPLAEELELFVRDRKEHIEQLVQPALADGKIVILDRYFYSTIAYQGSRGADPVEIETMMDFAPVPDMVLFLDAPPEVTLHRISNSRNETPNEFERLEPLTECRRIFTELAGRRPEIFTVDALQSPEVVEKQIIDLLLKNALLHSRCAKSYTCDIAYCSLRLSGQCQWAKLNELISQKLAAQA